ncbi:MAG TPA: phosphoribosylamine--glycine ligase [Hungateiclostridium thermocellum]|jgi:phosphoribosylamine--glycine ligase|uniref:Phosphoribosylamine--glycine ligase n=2 Tax=Acetivibrio thermocellus TaxID=1515 RepID=A3DEU8_ACET2|nr:phosphoribosylamine--glycine ligase [Acetivibrio thermocellus]CDG35914.1 Phosphoribosylamine-glycine ligase [Acetivibrio thermocellus BC1]ABN52477.1 phosphoribosylamine/glycine ligase [Acetivibrio thermocellus ATCC 27405]ADU74081.1 phosphoribosylamine/glycine ligase [Acetivibrio thermocellus DSM 1313]ALX08019.1 Phosphoribosylamine--glycine ligase [Acetivibrio thermocellus AD2]ANV75766.1 Phosphoribosylamine--glycine ligase [Acetivibrio thermocellus DSM 2360]
MKVLVVGSGGREHALVWKIVQSPRVEKVYCAPGNGGISAIAECVPIKAMDIEGIVNFSKEKKIDMVVVAPDDPLAAGMVDALEEAGIRAFGPNKAAAVIESSKAFAKNLMKKYNIPTARYEIFENSADAINYLQDQKYPVVVKADGLALGKGVIIAQNFDEAKQAVQSIMEDKVFGEAGNKVVIEEFLVGQEVSMLAFTDGKTIKTMVSSQDHKRALDNDQGLNTGGMGTFSPSRIYTEEIDRYCMERIYKPTIEAMEKEGRKFKGVLYFGLIITKDGPKVLEYNARFGDPETQVVLPRLNTDIIDIFEAVIDERLDEVEISWNDSACVCVIMASGGYPKEYKTGYEISGIEDAERDANIVVFHAGTKRENGKYYTAGGRVLGVTAMENTLDEAIKKAYEGVGKIKFQDMHYRKDIGKK